MSIIIREPETIQI